MFGKKSPTPNKGRTVKAKAAMEMVGTVAGTVGAVAMAGMMIGMAKWIWFPGSKAEK